MSRIIFFLVLFLFCSIFSRAAFAQDLVLRPTSFSIDDKIYTSKEEIPTTFTLNSCSQELRVRPVVDAGMVEIFNPKSVTWISANSSSWEAFPYVAEKMKVRVTSGVDTKVLLKFEMQNVKIGAVTKSKGLSLWISDALESYINTLNASLIQKAPLSTW